VLQPAGRRDRERLALLIVLELRRILR